MNCHLLFSDMTLQSQILVIESLFLTSVSKFIRKYLLSRQFSYMYSSCSNPLLPLSNLATIDKRKFHYRCLISVHCTRPLDMRHLLCACAFEPSRFYSVWLSKAKGQAIDFSHELSVQLDSK